jgi:hypothetical protein
MVWRNEPFRRGFLRLYIPPCIFVLLPNLRYFKYSAIPHDFHQNLISHYLLCCWLSSYYELNSQNSKLTVARSGGPAKYIFQIWSGGNCNWNTSLILFLLVLRGPLYTCTCKFRQEKFDLYMFLNNCVESNNFIMNNNIYLIWKIYLRRQKVFKIIKLIRFPKRNHFKENMGVTEIFSTTEDDVIIKRQYPLYRNVIVAILRVFVFRVMSNE